MEWEVDEDPVAARAGLSAGVCVCTGWVQGEDEEGHPSRLLCLRGGVVRRSTHWGVGSSGLIIHK